MRYGYRNGFAPRDGLAKHPSLWRGCVGAWCPSLGPSGTTLYDWSGRRQHGTLTNFTLSSAWTLTEGKYGLVLDGVDDAPTIQDAVALRVVDMTVSMFFKASSWVSEPTFFAKGDLGGGKSAGFGLTHYDLDGKFYFYWSSFAAGSATTWTRTDNTTHLLFVKSGTIATLTLTDTITREVRSLSFSGLGSNSANTESLKLGSSNKGVFAGMIDDVRIYPIAIPGIGTTLAARRGIAYELDERRFSGQQAAGFRAYWARQRSYVIGGGVQ